MMRDTMSRRTVLAGMLAGAAALAVTRTASLAQEATPATPSEPPPPEITGYPELDVTVTDSAIEVAQSQIPAGYVLLKVTNKSSDETGAGVIGPGEGQTMDDLKAAAATPASGDGFPSFLYTATIPGGPGSLQPGQTGEVIVHIPAGDWAVFPEGNQPPTFFTAADGADSNTTAPTTSITLELGDFSFGGVDNVPAGPQIWEVTNTGKQPHMVSMVKVPDGTTLDQLMATLMTEEAGTPTAGAISPDQMEFSSYGVLLLSSGQSMYLPLDVDGTYGLLCFVTDPSTGKPHAMEGMIDLFTTGGAATPAS